MVQEVKPRSRIMLYILLGIVVVSASGVVYFAVFYAQTCNSYECFSTAMQGCQKATFIHDTPDSAWGYRILGSTGDDCEVRVRLLLAKTSPLGFEKLQGYSMVCSYPEGISTYPEEDLSRCTGQLKEKLQEIIITKLHTYIVQNIGNLTENLQTFN